MTSTIIYVGAACGVRPWANTRIGAAFAHLQIKIALEELLQRFRAFRCPTEDQLQWSGALLVHAVTALPVRLQ